MRSGWRTSREMFSPDGDADRGEIYTYQIFCSLDLITHLEKRQGAW
jgi:hypothetical protein